MELEGVCRRVLDGLLKSRLRQIGDEAKTGVNAVAQDVPPVWTPEPETRLPHGWDLAIDGTTGTLTDCVVQRGGVTTELTVTAFTITAKYIGVKVTPTATGYDYEILQGATLASVTDADPADVSNSLKRVLYRLGGSSAAGWYVELPYVCVLGAGMFW
jgi:hypothetical protein